MSFYNHFNPKTHQNSSQIIDFSAILPKNSTIQTGSSTEQHINEFKKKIESHCSFRDNSLFLHWKHLADDAKSWFRQQIRPHCNFSQDRSFSEWHGFIAKELSEEMQLEAKSFSRPQGKHNISYDSKKESFVKALQEIRNATQHQDNSKNYNQSELANNITEYQIFLSKALSYIKKKQNQPGTSPY